MVRTVAARPPSVPVSASTPGPQKTGAFGVMLVRQPIFWPTTPELAPTGAGAGYVKQQLDQL